MLRPFEAQPCPLVLKLDVSLAASHRPRSHRLNLLQLHESASARDVCGLSIHKAQQSHSAKPQSYCEAKQFRPREAPA